MVEETARYMRNLKNHFHCKILRIILLGGLLMVQMGCSGEEETPPTTPATKREYPDQESWESTIIITRDGRKVAEVWAGYIAYYKKKQQTLLKDSIHVVFYDRQGHHSSVLTAREGIVYHRTNNLLARGSVVVVSDSGIVLQTEELRWDNRRQKIISHVPVIFTTQTDTIEGDSFISDPDLNHYEIRNPRGYSRRTIPLKKSTDGKN